MIAPPSTQAELDVVTTIAENARGPMSARPANQMRQLFVYTVKAMPGNTIAFAFLPNSASPFSVDGVYISQEFILKPESDLAYHYPHTLSHEVGHWLTREFRRSFSKALADLSVLYSGAHLRRRM